MGVTVGLTFACLAGLHGQGPNQASPAAQPRPETERAQAFSVEQVDAGRAVFVSRCGFCHGREAAGGAGGSDLTRSELVASDYRGDQIGPVVRSGRNNGEMPAFDLSDPDLIAVVAYIHSQKTQADQSVGGRRAVDVADLQTGDAGAGRRYFDTACASCHAAGGDLAGVASRFQGLALLQRMLYPGSEGRGPSSAVTPPTVRVTLPSGEVVSGALAYRDEFVIAVTDADGWYHSWPTGRVTVEIDDPLEAHVDQLARYTDQDMHDVLAFLQTLR